MNLPIAKINLLVIILIGALTCSLIFESREQFNDSVNVLTKHIDHVYYINLEHRKDRNNEFLDNFNSKDKTRIDRVKGHYYSDNGAVGCLMSHITALNIALNDANSGENILICEDDFYVKDMDYCNKMLELFFSKIDSWDVIMLGHNTIESKDTGIQTEQNEKIIKILNSQTTSGYMIKKQYIPRILEIWEKDMQEYLKTNEWGNFYTDQSWKVLQPKDNWYSFTPSVAHQRTSYSDIQKGVITEF